MTTIKTRYSSNSNTCTHTLILSLGLLTANNKYHSRAYRHTGNVRSVREIQGNNLILLSLYRVALPKATHAEVNAFLYEMNSHDPHYQIYSPSQICRAEQRIHLTKKRTSTTAYQALEPRNVQWRENYWNMNYPFGIADIDPRKVIDLDEAAGSVAGDQAERYQNHG